MSIYPILLSVETFTEWLRGQLSVKGWSQQDLARRSGVTQAAVSRIMNGTRQPGAEFCAGVARAFAIPEADVFRRAGLMSSRRSAQPDVDPISMEILNIAAQLSDDDRQDLVDLARAKLARRERAKGITKAP